MITVYKHSYNVRKTETLLTYNFNSGYSRKSIMATSRMDSGVDSRSELYQSSGGDTTVSVSVSEQGDMVNIVNSHGEKR